MAKRTKKSPTLTKRKVTTKRLGMTTRSVTRLSTQPHVSTQYLPGCEDNRSTIAENKGSNVSTTQMQQEERPIITTEPALKPLPLP